MSNADVFSVPRPSTTAPGLTGQPPLPIGRPMMLKNPSPGERAILEELGWEEGQPVPDNLGAIIKAAKEGATNTDLMSPPVPLNTPSLQLPPEKDIADLPADDQQRYLNIVKQAMAVSQTQYQQDQQVSNALVDSAGAGVNEAIRQSMAAADAVELENDLAKPVYATGQDKSQPPLEFSKEKQPGDRPDRCSQCGWVVADEDLIPVTQADKDMFLQSVLGGVPFIKTYSTYGGKLKISARTLTPDEIDMCFQQRLIDLDVKRAKTPTDELELLTRYRAALQVTEVISGERALTLPRSITAWKEQAQYVTVAEEGDTPVRAVWSLFAKHVCKTETLHRAVMSTVFRFNQLVRKLEDNSSNPDFW